MIGPKRRTALSIAIALAFPAPTVQGADFQVIVHPTNPRSRVTLEELGKIFMKKIVRWDTDIPIIPVNQAGKTRVRALFTRMVHGKPESALAAYWQQQIFSGRALPPVEKSDDAAVITFVKAEPGAVGYLTPGAILEGVKLLAIP